MTGILPIVVGLAGSLVIAGFAYWRRSLSFSGLIAALVLGTALYAISGPAWYGTLIIFFIGSSLLSKVKRSRKQHAEQFYEKGGGRDAGQVAANGGLPLLFAAGFAIWPHEAWWYAYIGALAAVNADTWATELGALSYRQPRSILNGRPVDPGTSGGITLAGLAASLAGGCFIGLTAWLLSLLSGGVAVGLAEGSVVGGMAVQPHSGPGLGIKSGLLLVVLGGCAGLVGSLSDSVLGASVQAGWRCRVCNRLTEREEHCGIPSEHVKGWRLFRNDQVNASAGACGAAVAAILGLWI